MKYSLVIIKPQEQRSHDLAACHGPLTIAEAADHTIGAAVTFDLLHAFAIARLVRQIETLRNDAVAATAR